MNEISEMQPYFLIFDLKENNRAQLIRNKYNIQMGWSITRNFGVNGFLNLPLPVEYVHYALRNISPSDLVTLKNLGYRYGDSRSGAEYSQKEEKNPRKFLVLISRR